MRESDSFKLHVLGLAPSLSVTMMGFECELVIGAVGDRVDR